jgi:hypothetical protein
MSHFVADQATTEKLTALEDLEGLLRNKIRIFGATICHVTRRIDALEGDRPERKPWITDPWYIAMPADAIFALVPMVTTASLCAFSTFGAAFPSMTCFTFAFT